MKVAAIAVAVGALFTAACEYESPEEETPHTTTTEVPTTTTTEVPYNDALESTETPPNEGLGAWYPMCFLTLSDGSQIGTATSKCVDVSGNGVTVRGNPSLGRIENCNAVSAGTCFVLAEQYNSEAGYYVYS